MFRTSRRCCKWLTFVFFWCPITSSFAAPLLLNPRTAAGCFRARCAFVGPQPGDFCCASVDSRLCHPTRCITAELLRCRVRYECTHLGFVYPSCCAATTQAVTCCGCRCAPSFSAPLPCWFLSHPVPSVSYIRAALWLYPVEHARQSLSVGKALLFQPRSSLSFCSYFSHVRVAYLASCQYAYCLALL